MKTIIKSEIRVCDACKSGEYAHPCLGCGIDHCYKCMKKLGVEYSHAVHFSGSGDGYYCHKCNSRLSQSSDDKLYLAYVAIRDLQQESKRWSYDFKKRYEKAEKELENLSK